MKAVMVMFDTLNRHMLPPYGCDWTHAPNFTRLAERTVTFDNCYVGSMPCMPARREMHTGRYNFLHRSWGPLEPFDDSMPQILSEQGIYTHLSTDHQHYFEDGGATYHTRYDSWDFHRGQEGGPVDRTGRRPRRSREHQPHHAFHCQTAPRGHQSPRRGYFAPGLGSTGLYWTAKKSNRKQRHSLPGLTSSAATRIRTTGFYRWKLSTRTSPFSLSRNTKTSIPTSTTASCLTGPHTGRWKRQMRRCSTFATSTRRCSACVTNTWAKCWT